MKNFGTLCLLFLITALTFGFTGGNDGQSKTNPNRFKQLQSPLRVPVAPLSPHQTSGSPYYIDNFDGANDTTALKARGYKVYFRGTGRDNTKPLWFQGNPGEFPAYNGPGNGYVASNYETVTGTNNIDNWLVLPAQNVQANDTLYFYTRSPDGSPFPDSIRVMYSAIGDTLPEGGGWIELGRFQVPTSGLWERSGFRAPTTASGARFAIRYAVPDGGPNGSNSNYIGIDALTIERPGVLNDVGVVGNVAPIGTIQANSATIAPKAIVRNFGLGNQSITSAFNVTYSISPGGYSSTKTISSLASQSSTTVTFDSTFSPNSVGTYNFTIVTNLGTDENRSNDTLRGSFVITEMNWGGGGANSGGYYFANSVAVGAPSRPGFGWIDPIFSGHTEVVFANYDDGRKSVDLGFPFTYFGTLFPVGANNLNIYTNGFLTLGTPGSAAIFSATSIPSASNPANMIAPCLIDLDLTPTTYPNAKAYYGGDANKFVVTYFHAYRYSTGVSTDYITFQLIFYPNGNIKIQYDDSESSIPHTVFLNEGDIGIQNTAGTAGLQYRVNGTGGPIFGSPLAVEFGTDSNALPVQLFTFTGNVQQSAVRLDWTTLSELNNFGFYVERRGNAQQRFETLANSFVPGHGTTIERHDYSYLDNNLPGPGLYYYRLRQVDLDGAEHTSEPISVAFSPASVNETTPTKFALFQNYPNPFNPSTQIKFSVEETKWTGLELYNVLGQKVATLFNGVAEAGRYYTINVNGTRLSSGLYMYRLQSGSRTDFKKMLLLK